MQASAYYLEALYVSMNPLGTTHLWVTNKCTKFVIPMGCYGILGTALALWQYLYLACSKNVSVKVVSTQLKGTTFTRCHLIDEQQANLVPTEGERLSAE